MSNPSISAVRDDRLIRVNYRYMSSVMTTDAVPLVLRVYHKFTNSFQEEETLTLLEKIIPVDAFTSNPDYNENPRDQSIDLILANLRYLDNLEVEFTENRGSGSVATRVPVLVNTENPEPTANPIRFVENEENEPALKPEKPTNNVIELEPIINPVVYVMSDSSPLVRIISSRRIRPDQNCENFIVDGVNSSLAPQIVENAISNYALNPKLAGLSPIPTGYSLVAPGFILNSLRFPLPNTDGNYWEIRTSNPNPFNTLNTVKWSYADKQPLVQGLASLNYSFYYQIQSVLSGVPAAGFKIKVTFFDSSDTTVGSKTNNYQFTYSSSSGTSKWYRASMSMVNTDIPLSAVQYSVEVETDPVEGDEFFYWRIALPQLEASPFATSATFTDRIPDRWEVSPVELEMPIYFSLNATYHIDGGVRGLFDSTLNGEDGIKFIISQDRLNFRVVDTSGMEVVNLFSDQIPVNMDNQVVKFGVFVQPNSVQFFLNNTPLSTHSLAVNEFSTNRRTLVGSLEASNSALNDLITGVGIFKRTP